jgi:hypothetical protein
MRRVALATLALLMLAAPASALDPTLAEVPELESLRQYQVIARRDLQRYVDELAVQRAYAKRLEQAIEVLETKLSVTEKALNAKGKDTP